MNIKIDQEVMCEFCKDHYEFPSSFMCEGGKCDEIKPIYLESNGLVEDEKQTFSDLDPGDIVFVIENDTIHEIEIDSINHLKDSLILISGEEKYSVTKGKGKLTVDFFGIFLKKTDAVERYQELISLKMLKMAQTLAKYIEK